MQGLRKLANTVYNIPKSIKILICIITFFPFGLPLLFFFFIFIPALKQGFDLEDRTNDVINNPTEENLLNLMQCLETSSVNNHPDTWQRLRGLWNVVNKSNRITTPTKEKFIAMLMAKGLYLNNTNVIDNYGKQRKHQNAKTQNNRINANIGNNSDSCSDDIFMQEEMQRQNDEWAMEESRKAVTPFDMGGYVQGDGFNPSDTMAADMQREQMNQMNNMNDMGMF